MLKSFIRTTLRNAWKNKSYTALNVLGLAVGIACAGLIFIWVEDEMSYDSMYAKKNQLYWVRELQTYEGAPRVFNATPGPLAAAMKEELPGVVNTCRATSSKKLLFAEGEKRMYESGFYADASFFQLFSTVFTEGNAANAFSQVHSIVVTQEMARRLFGTDVNIVGRTVLTDNTQTYTISGVIRDVPDNSSLQFDWLISFDVFMKDKKWLRSWPANGLRTYVELSPAADVAAINRQLDGFIHAHDAKANARSFLFAMNDWRLRDHFEAERQTGGRIVYIRLFVIIAWIILFIACINFMNLATARSDKRAREVGVRKVLGAARHGLALQFIGESVFLSAVSVLLGMLLIGLIMPAFNLLVEKQLHPDFLRPAHALALLVITLLCGLAAGSYPALYLSSFNPVFVFKGIRIKGNTPALVRRGLVVLQFTVSIVLIICTTVVYQQIQHIRHRDIGYNRENLLDTDVRGDMVKNYASIRHDLLATGLIENTALASTESIQTTDNTDSYTWDGKAPGSHTLISIRTVSPEYLSTMGMRLLEGSDFYQDSNADSSQVIITASLGTLMGKGSAIGKTLRNGDRQYTVKGVIKDYVYGDMNSLTSDPVIFFPSRSQGRHLYVRSRPQAATANVLAALEAVLHKDNPGYPFEYSFVDDQYASVFSTETLTGRLSRIFAALAILISCVGLFGLAAYTAERRTKEIGVRKVLGAGTGRIAFMLSRDFLKLVLIATLIAWPIAGWYMQRWLQEYTYRISLQVWVFAAAGLAALLIALATIGLRALKAGMMSPVKSLRSE